MTMHYVQIITNIPAAQVINYTLELYPMMTVRIVHVSLNSSTFCHEFVLDVLYVIVMYA